MDFHLHPQLNTLQAAESRGILSCTGIKNCKANYFSFFISDNYLIVGHFRIVCMIGFFKMHIENICFFIIKCLDIL